MALVNTNTGRFEQFNIEGGTIEFDWTAGGAGGGADTYSMLGIVEGSVRLQHPDVDRIVDRDKGALIGTPRRGNETPGALEFRGKVTDDIGANSVYTNARDNDDAAGGIPTFQVVVKRPSFRGATIGTTYTATKCYFLAQPDLEPGAEYDEVVYRIGILGTVTTASYS